MIETIEIAPHIFAQTLLEVLYDASYIDLVPTQDGYLNIDGAAMKKRFLEAMGVKDD